MLRSRCLTSPVPPEREWSAQHHSTEPTQIQLRQSIEGSSGFTMRGCDNCGLTLSLDTDHSAAALHTAADKKNQINTREQPNAKHQPEADPEYLAASTVSSSPDRACPGARPSLRRRGNCLRASPLIPVVAACHHSSVSKKLCARRMCALTD